MKKAFLFVIAALAIACVASCKKPIDDPVGPVGPVDPDPSDTEITVNNSAPGGFTDGGTMDWYE